MQRFGSRTALIVVDVQNDFADPAGSLYVAGGEAVVPFVNRQVDLARAAGATVIYTQDWHPASTPHFAKDGGIWPVHCVAGTWGAELHPDLTVAGAIVHKGASGEDGYSGFTMRDLVSGTTQPTELDGILRGAGVEEIVVVGLATDYCVLATALDARERDYPVTLLAEGIRAVDLAEGDGARAIERMRAEGVVIVEDAAPAGDGAPAPTASTLGH